MKNKIILNSLYGRTSTLKQTIAKAIVDILIRHQENEKTLDTEVMELIHERKCK